MRHRGAMNKSESKTTHANATDIRPTENVHADPGLSEHSTRRAGELSKAQSEAILRIATDVRPDENFHAET